MSVQFKSSLAQEIALWLYSLSVLLLWATSFVRLPFYLNKTKKQKLSRHLQRLGWLPSNLAKSDILIHCVSVGEVVAASPLIKRLLASQPDLEITVTTTTATGAERVKQILGDSVHHCYLPYDTPAAMRRLITRLEPKKVLITEVELWPNMLDICWKQNIPTFVINGRMTDKSVKAYSKVSALFTPMLLKLTGICAQGERDHRNYLQLGVDHNKLWLTHNMKFDLTMDHDVTAASHSLKKQLHVNKRKILIAGSTHDPEEIMLLECYKTLKHDFPELLLILVPRHPHRFKPVQELIEQHALQYVQLSKQQQCDSSTDVLLADVMGQLQSLYGIAEVAFVGGSITERGGHNPLEPAAFSIPVVMGPSNFNNPQIYQSLKQAGALKTVDSTQSATQIMKLWLREEQARNQAGKAGEDVLKNNSGAINNTLKVIEQV